MRLRASRPSVLDLYAAPELAVLAVLEAGIDVALVALIAAHPDDDDDDDDEPVPPERRAAQQLIELARDRERHDLLPF